MKKLCGRGGRHIYGIKIDVVMNKKQIEKILNLRKLGSWTESLTEGLLLGALAGIVACAFRATCTWAAGIPAALASCWRQNIWLLPLWLLGASCAALFLGYLVLKVPLISGSGIPQTELMLQGRLHLSRSDWWKILPAKFLSCVLGYFCGFSIGRAAPCVQIGAAVSSILNGLGEHFFRGGPQIHAAVGSVAGLTAAFGSPVAAFLFAFEEMGVKKTLRGLLFLCSASLASGVITFFFFGRLFLLDTSSLIFGHPLFSDSFSATDGAVFFSSVLPTSCFLALGVGILAGIAGSLHCRLLMNIKNAEAARSRLPQPLRILPLLLPAVLCLFFLPDVMGGGEILIAKLLHAASSLVHSASSFNTNCSDSTAFAVGSNALPSALSLPNISTARTIFSDISFLNISEKSVLFSDISFLKISAGLAVLYLAKTVFSAFCGTGNTPGGILMPTLCGGALFGAFMGCLILGLTNASSPFNFLENLDSLANNSSIHPEIFLLAILYGMAGFFAAVIRAPLASAVLIMETTGIFLPEAFLAVFAACGTARLLHTKPIFQSLKEGIVMARRK